MASTSRVIPTQFQPPLDPPKNGSKPAPVPAPTPNPASSRGRQGAPVVVDRILRLIEDGMGKSVYVDDIARDLDINEASVQNAIRRLQSKVLQIETVIRGRAWRWVESSSNATEQTSAPAPAPEAEEKPKPSKTKTPREQRSPRPAAGTPTTPLTFTEVGRAKDRSLIIRGSDDNMYRAERI